MMAGLPLRLVSSCLVCSYGFVVPSVALAEECDSRRLLREAQAFESAGRQQEAISTYRRASSCGGKSALPRLARLFRNEGRLVDALEVLREYLSSPDVPEPTRGNLTKAVTEYERLVGRLFISFGTEGAAGAEIRIDGTLRTAPSREQPIYVSPGTKVLEVSKAGHASHSETIEMSAGEAERRLIVLQPLPDVTASVPKEREEGKSGPHPELEVQSAATGGDSGEPSAWWTIGTFAALGTGVISSALGTYWGFSARSDWSSASDTCRRTPCSDLDAVQLGERAGDNADRATVAFALGGALLGTSLTLWLLGPNGSEAPEISATFGRDYQGVSLRKAY